MGDTPQQASGASEADASKGKPAEPQTPPIAEADADRKQQPSAEEQTKSELKKLNDRLAEAGRTTKAEREARERLEGELKELRDQKDKLWFTHPDTPEAEKDAFRRSREAEAKDAPKLAQANNRIALAEAIADEEDPTIRKALKVLQAKAKESGKYPESYMVNALRESLAPEGSGAAVQHEEEPPIAVGASRGTRSAAGPSIDEQIKIVETSVRNRDGKYSYGDLLSLRQQSQMEARAANKG